MLVFSLFTGHNLESFAEIILIQLPFMILAIPAFINMAGDLADVFTARITSSLFVGSLNSRFKPRRLLLSNLVGVLLVAISGFIILGATISALNIYLALSETDPGLILISIILAGFTATGLMCMVGVGAAYITYRRGLNPDNFTPPLTTTLGDAVGTILLIWTVTLLIQP